MNTNTNTPLFIKERKHRQHSPPVPVVEEGSKRNVKKRRSLNLRLSYNSSQDSRWRGTSPLRHRPLMTFFVPSTIYLCLIQRNYWSYTYNGLAYFPGQHCHTSRIAYKNIHKCYGTCIKWRGKVISHYILMLWIQKDGWKFCGHSQFLDFFSTLQLIFPSVHSAKKEIILMILITSDVIHRLRLLHNLHVVIGHVNHLFDHIVRV